MADIYYIAMVYPEEIERQHLLKVLERLVGRHDFPRCEIEIGRIAVGFQINNIFSSNKMIVAVRPNANFIIFRGFMVFCVTEEAFSEQVIFDRLQQKSSYTSLVGVIREVFFS